MIISDALTFRLNRLSIGETLDADTAARCLDGLNSVVDELNGNAGTLYREIRTAGTVTGVSATFTAVWPALSSGDPIAGATYLSGTMDLPLNSLSLAQYHESIADKSTQGVPQYYVHDGAETVFFWPVPTSTQITLRTMQPVASFSDLDTDYAMPDGWRSGLAALLAETMAPAMLGGVSPAIAKAASAARARLLAQAVQPAILNGNVRRWNIYAGR